MPRRVHPRVLDVGERLEGRVQWARREELGEVGGADVAVPPVPQQSHCRVDALHAHSPARERVVDARFCEVDDGAHWAWRTAPLHCAYVRRACDGVHRTANRSRRQRPLVLSECVDGVHLREVVHRCRPVVPAAGAVGDAHRRWCRRSRRVEAHAHVVHHGALIAVGVERPSRRPILLWKSRQPHRVEAGAQCRDRWRVTVDARGVPLASSAVCRMRDAPLRPPLRHRTRVRGLPGCVGAGPWPSTEHRRRVRAAGWCSNRRSGPDRIAE